jgi:hypothetical protein
MELAYCHRANATTQSMDANLPKAAIWGLQRALLASNTGTEAATETDCWLGTTTKSWNFFYLSEPNILLQTSCKTTMTTRTTTTSSATTTTTMPTMPTMNNDDVIRKQRQQQRRQQQQQSTTKSVGTSAARGPQICDQFATCPGASRAIQFYSTGSTIQRPQRSKQLVYCVVNIQPAVMRFHDGVLSRLPSPTQQHLSVSNTEAYGQLGRLDRGARAHKSNSMNIPMTGNVFNVETFSTWNVSSV